MLLSIVLQGALGTNEHNMLSGSSRIGCPIWECLPNTFKNRTVFLG